MTDPIKTIGDINFKSIEAKSRSSEEAPFIIIPIICLEKKKQARAISPKTIIEKVSKELKSFFTLCVGFLLKSGINFEKTATVAL